MARTCDLCGGKIGWKAFHCQDGAVCKRCYRMVSGNFAAPITGLTLQELKRRYVRSAQPLNLGPDGFSVTKKAGVFLLLDEEREKFCLPNHRRNRDDTARPEIYGKAELLSACLSSRPALTREELDALARERREGAVVERLSVVLRLQGERTREIAVIPTPVRGSSFAFRQGLKTAEEILDLLNDWMNSPI